MTTKKRFSIKYNKNRKGMYKGGDFEELILNSGIFSDKTSFIKDIMEYHSKLILILMPKGWGKSTNLDMLNMFLSEERYNKEDHIMHNRLLYFDRPNNAEESLDITKEKIIEFGKSGPSLIDSKSYCCTESLLYLNFSNCEGASYKMVKKNVQRVILKTIFENYSKLRKSMSDYDKKVFDNLMNCFDVSDLKFSLVTFLNFLYKLERKKIWILIDDFDVALNHAYINFSKEEATQVISLFKEIYSALFKDNPCIKKAILTGTQELGLNLVLSELNFSVFGMNDYTFSKYFGVNNEELQLILKHYNINKEKEKVIRKMIKGYKLKVKSEGKVILQDNYDFLSITSILNDKDNEYNNNWMDSSIVPCLKPLLADDEFREKIVDLILGKSISIMNLNSHVALNTTRNLIGLNNSIKNSVQPKTTFNFIFSYLFNNGFLTITENANEYIMPNYHIKKAFSNDIIIHYQDEQIIDEETQESFEKLSQIICRIFSCIKKKEIKTQMDEFISEFNNMFKDNFLRKSFKDDIERYEFIVDEYLFKSIIDYMIIIFINNGIDSEERGRNLDISKRSAFAKIALSKKDVEIELKFIYEKETLLQTLSFDDPSRGRNFTKFHLKNF
jgi:hypothetical protein